MYYIKFGTCVSESILCTTMFSNEGGDFYPLLADSLRKYVLRELIKIRIWEVDDDGCEAEKKGQISNSKRSGWREAESKTVSKN